MLFERGVALSEFAGLTDAQIDEVINHPRDAEGKLKTPPAPAARPSMIEAMMQVDQARAAFGMSDEQYAEAIAIVRESYQEG